MVGTLEGTWHDQVPEIAAAARTMLRLAATDPDLSRLVPAAASACSQIDQFLNLLPHADRMAYLLGGVVTVTYSVDDVPADVVAGAVQLAGELFRRKDAPFGVLNATSPNGMPLYISKDSLTGVLSLIGPYREGWGFA